MIPATPDRQPPATARIGCQLHSMLQPFKQFASRTEYLLQVYKHIVQSVQLEGDWGKTSSQSQSVPYLSWLCDEKAVLFYKSGEDRERCRSQPIEHQAQQENAPVVWIFFGVELCQ